MEKDEKDADAEPQWRKAVLRMRSTAVKDEACITVTVTLQLCCRYGVLVTETS